MYNPEILMTTRPLQDPLLAPATEEGTVPFLCMASVCCAYITLAVFPSDFKPRISRVPSLP